MQSPKRARKVPAKVPSDLVRNGLLDETCWPNQSAFSNNTPRKIRARISKRPAAGLLLQKGVPVSPQVSSGTETGSPTISALKVASAAPEGPGAEAEPSSPLFVDRIGRCHNDLKKRVEGQNLHAQRSPAKKHHPGSPKKGAESQVGLRPDATMGEVMLRDFVGAASPSVIADIHKDHTKEIRSMMSKPILSKNAPNMSEGRRNTLARKTRSLMQPSRNNY